MPAAIFSGKDNKPNQPNKQTNKQTKEIRGNTQNHVIVSKFTAKAYLKSWKLMFLKVIYAVSRYLSGELKQN